MMENALIIFVKNPELGKVKTRLAAQIGPEAALDIYKRLLQHTLAISRSVDPDKFVFYADEIIDNDLWEVENFYKFLQDGQNLGSRMEAAFHHVFKEGYKKVVIIGSDCFELTSQIIEQAFNQLNNYDILIGPANDGGYYLLGMKNLYKQLFTNKAWSTASVFAETITTIRQLGLTCYQLQKLTDVDEAKDLPDGWNEF